ncbi:MAG: hypothetical protein ACJ0PP_06035 [Flavobacteriaceae bacterium]
MSKLLIKFNGFSSSRKNRDEMLNYVLNNPKKTFPRGLYPTLRLVFKS